MTIFIFLSTGGISMNTREEEYILALDKYLSITQASEYLHVTQPTLSIFLSKLEKNAGTMLFERVGKRLIPTQTGQVYIKYARQIMVISKNFELETAALKKEQQGQLCVGCLEKRSHFLMPRLFRQFKELHSNIDAILYNDHLEQLFEALTEGKVDLIYANKDLQFPELNSQPVCSEHLLLVLPANHPAAAYARPVGGCPFPYLDLKHVEKETFYVPDKGYSIRFLIDDAIQYCKANPQTIRPIKAISLGCQMASEGLGISFTTEAYIRTMDYPLPSCYFLTGDLSQKVEWKVFWRKSAVLPRYMLDFIDMLKAEEQKSSVPAPLP